MAKGEKKGSAVRGFKAEEFYLSILERFPNPVWRSGLKAEDNYFNQAWLEFTGFRPEETKGDGWLRAVHPDDREYVKQNICCGEKKSTKLLYRLRHHSGQYRWVEEHCSALYSPAGEFSGYIRSCYDITEQRQREAEPGLVGAYDPLTGLPTKRLFAERLGLAISMAARKGRYVAVLHVDLDHFKLLNEFLGYEMGDELLRAVSSRLLGCVRQGDTVARLEADEFLMALADMAHGQDAALVAQRVVNRLSSPFQIGDRELFLSASIGIALYPQDSREIAGLLSRADAAMYRARQMGGNTFMFFTTEMNEQIFRRLQMEDTLRRALQQKEFLLHFQQQVDASQMRPVGLEALLRWNHPTLGVLPPSDFIPVAEETGLILSIGEWVLREACKVYRQLAQRGLQPLRVAVNISQRQFKYLGLPGFIEKLLKAEDMPGHMLELEITESMVMSDPVQTSVTLHKLKELGVRVVIDDFGAGYSSISYLKRLPIDRVKIDKSFVHDMLQDAQSMAIVRTIIAMARSMDLEVMAEGVETKEQMEALKKEGCQLMQGYLFGRPMPPESLAAVLKAQESTGQMIR
jgi:diguanylate cyclase (GGDEF)-like protein/PAS domain S-box-containing protein